MSEERKILTLWSSLDDVIERTNGIANQIDQGHAFAEIACAILILANEIKSLKPKSEERHLTLPEQRIMERSLNRSVRFIA